MGKDVFFLSITIDAEFDAPDVMSRYRKANRIDDPAWIHLTGDYDEIEQLRRTLGVYDLDPEVDKDKDQHAGIVVFGNDRTNWWASLPALMNFEELAQTIAQITSPKRRALRHVPAHRAD